MGAIRARVATRESARRRTRASSFERLAELWPAPLAFLIITLVWEAIIRLTHTPAYIVPAPSVILVHTAATLPSLLSDAVVTVGEALGGLVVASICALSAATVMAHFRWAERAFFPVAVAIKVTPVVAVAPLLVIWLGFGPAPKILVAALISYFPLLSNAMTGFRSVNPRALEFLHSLHASRREIFFCLRLPHAMPYLFSAYKVATTLSVIGAVVSEWVGADKGLGHVVILANANFDMTTLASAVLVLGIIGIALFLVVEAIERRLLFWHESVLTTEVYK